MTHTHSDYHPPSYQPGSGERIESEHRWDEAGNPAGGTTTGVGFEIRWQDGPVGDGEPSGAFVEGVINAVIDRLEFFQHSGFRCDANAAAIQNLLAARYELQSRTADRRRRGVEGRNVA